jgi:hypothetical protein
LVTKPGSKLKGNKNKRKERGRLRQKNTSNDASDDDKDRCFWCLKKGHIKRECRDFQRAKAKARKGRESKAESGETAKLANSSRVTEIDTDVSAYMASNQSDSTDRTNWILDSGTTKHMCGDRRLFRSIKRFPEPQPVRLADSSTILAYGKGLVEIQLKAGNKLSLTETWYTPELYHVRLISIISLNDHGIQVVFKPGRTVEASNAGRVLFTGSIRSGLVCLDVGPALRTTAYVAVDSTDRTDLTDVRKSEMSSIKP